MLIMQQAKQSKINIAIAGVGLEGLTELIDQLLSIPHATSVNVLLPCM